MATVRRPGLRISPFIKAGKCDYKNPCIIFPNAVGSIHQKRCIDSGYRFIDNCIRHTYGGGDWAVCFHKHMGIHCNGGYNVNINRAGEVEQICAGCQRSYPAFYYIGGIYADKNSKVLYTG